MIKKKIALSITILVLVIITGILYPPAQGKDKTISDLRLIVIATHRAGDIEFLDSILREDDIIFTYGAKVKLLKKVAGPMTMIGRGSVNMLEKELKKLKGVRVDYINYNPEHWRKRRRKSHTPGGETASLLDSVRRARLLADKYKTKLSFITDHATLERYGEKISPMVDMFGIQMQRYQRAPLEEFSRVAKKYVGIVRRGSKTVPVFIQLSLAPPKWEERVMPDGRRKRVLVRDEKGRKVYEPIPLGVVLEQIGAVKDICEGIAFLYDDETRSELRKLISTLRMH